MSDSDGNVDLQKILNSRPPNLHVGSQSQPKGSDCDIDDMIEKSGCAKVYYELEECMGVNDRVWSKCQVEVKTLKLCNDQQKKR